MNTEHVHEWRKRTVHVCDCGQWDRNRRRGMPKGYRQSPEHVAKRIATRGNSLAERNRQWAEMYRTMSAHEIARQENTTYQTVRFALLSIGVWRPRPVIKTNWDEVVRLVVDEGLTLQIAGERLGISRERVRQLLVKAGHKGFGSQRRIQQMEARIAALPTTRICKRCGEEYEIAARREHFAAGTHEGLRWGTEEAERFWEGAAADYASGMIINDICTKWDITPTSLMRTVKHHGILLRRPTARRGTRDEVIARKERIVHLCDLGYTYDEIAKAVGCSSAWVGLVLRPLGKRPVAKKSLRKRAS